MPLILIFQSRRWLWAFGSSVLLGWVSLGMGEAAIAQLSPLDTNDAEAPNFLGEQSWDASYLLGPGDRIAIDIFGAEDYSGEALVLSDGAVNLPRAGRVDLQGLTFEQAASAIAAAYAPYLRRAAVTVSPVALRSVNIGIAGEVNRPGAYALTTQNNQNDQGNQRNSLNFLTLTEAIELAGGITDRADLRQIEIRRPQANGREEVIEVDLWDLVDSGSLESDLILQGGDSVHVPTAQALTPEELTRLSSVSFAPDTIQIYVSGEVEAPGAIQVPPNTPLNQGLLAAGGFNRRAATDTIELVRLNPDGTVNKQTIPIDLAQGIDDTSNPILQDGDVLLVRRSGVATFSDNADLTLGPIGRILSILGIFF
ncbi:MAG: SLBB domain-containing protein [Cyanobacteria bacterium P01_A01_bin.123]